MLIEKATIYIIFAGIMNGSFVVPTRYMKCTSIEKAWLYHSFIGLVLVSWVIQAAIGSNFLLTYMSLPASIAIFVLFCGFIFGVGQICFAYAIEILGIGLAFAVNLSVGVIIGSIFTIIYRHLFFTYQGFLVIFSVILIVSAIVISFFSDKKSSKDIPASVSSAPHSIGWALVFFTGCTSGLQSIAFIVAAFHTSSMRTLDPFWIWPLFLTAAAIPMLVGFYMRLKKKKSTFSYAIDKNVPFLSDHTVDILRIIIMGFLFTGSLWLYGFGMKHLTDQSQIIGWPAFMVSIILASQVWDKVFRKKIEQKQKVASILKKFAILLLVISILLLNVAIF